MSKCFAYNDFICAKKIRVIVERITPRMTKTCELCRSVPSDHRVHLHLWVYTSGSPADAVYCVRCFGRFLEIVVDDVMDGIKKRLK
jgi:hypothetical protein